MALTIKAISIGLLFLLLLHFSRQQGCPDSSLEFPDMPENIPPEKYTLLNTTNRLVLNDDGDGYLALNVTPGPGSNSTYTLYINKTLDYEALNTPDISGHITCYDSQFPSGVPLGVHIIVGDVNEFAPEFKDAPYSISVREDTAPGTTLFRFHDRAKDGDATPNQNIVYSIVTGSPKFNMTNTLYGDIVLNTELDFETRPVQPYILNISAAETQGQSPLKTSFTTLTINITDVDDIGPRFGSNSYTLAFDEGTHTGELHNTVPQLSAVDGDTLGAAISFKLDPSSWLLYGSYYRVLANGSIAVNGTLSPGNFTLNVQAFQDNRPTDRFNVTSVSVTVRDINNHSPVMSHSTYTAQISEGAALDSFVLAVSASDQDQGINGQFKFHLANNNNNVFDITTDGTLGIIRVAAPLDREQIETYSLQVYAEEDQTPEKNRSLSSTITITVLDDNDNSPVFHEVPYSFVVLQNFTKGTYVGKVNATDNDKGENGHVSYSIPAQSGIENIFDIDSEGEITLKRPLAKEDVGRITLLVQAQDNAPQGQKRSSVAQVTVTVTAVNQYYPVFNQSPYTFSVSETAPVGYSIGTVNATDQDEDTLRFSMTGDQAFELRGDPPTLYITGSLDLDVPNAKPQRTLTVDVTDGQKTSTATVTVNVQYQNEFSPSFNQTAYFAYVLETATRGTQIVQLFATDGDSASTGDGTISYSIVDNDSAQVRINSTSGAITLDCDNCLDYNVKNQYFIVVEARDSGSPPKSSAVSVAMSVHDVNNKPPVFNPQSYTGTVPENVAAGRTILQLQATDEDTPTTKLTYNITSGNAATYLEVRGSYLVTKAILDAETAQFITGTVQVSDGVNTDDATVNITVTDENDNAPKLTVSPNPVQLPENTTVGKEVPVQVSATDIDISKNGFTYWLEGSAGKFSINRASGNITVIGAFDRRIQRQYNVSVTVSDNGSPPKFDSSILQVIITDSNTAPVFLDSSNHTATSYSFTVRENQTVPSLIGTIRAFDPDSGSSGQLRYSVVHDDDSQGVFVLDAITGELTLQKALDYEEKPSYSLIVQVTDNSFEPKSATASVSIDVDNVVEAPQWPSHFPAVTLTQSDQCDGAQGSGRPRTVGMYTATSMAKAGVTYSLVNLTTTFAMNSSTGLIQTKPGSGSLATGNYSLGLRACTTGTQVCSDTVVTLQVENDDAITFCPPFLTVHINESATTGHVIADLNSTKGDTDVTYRFIDPAPTEFSVNSDTGIVTLRKTLDREAAPQYSLLIAALYRPTNGTVTAQVTVVVDDAPDTPPKFLSDIYEGEINEAKDPRDNVTSIGSSRPLVLSAVDEDVNPELTFRIIRDNSGGAFDVDSTSRTIFLTRKVDLENMTSNLNHRYTLMVEVTDGYFTDNATVIIQVLNDNDNSPIFQPNSLNFTIKESQKMPHVIATLNATDGDAEDQGRLKYTIAQPSGSLPFSVEQSTGELSLSGQLDRENTSFYSFQVAATDPGGKSGTVMINITVADANDKKPVFGSPSYTLTVEEGPGGIGANITISASDNDLGDNAKLSFSIESGNTGGAFNIISSAGNSQAMIRVEKELDREATSTIQLVVRAVDGGQPQLTGTCTVDVTVTDINDNAPQFSPNRYSALVSEGALNNTKIQMSPSIRVIDPDTGKFGVAGVVYNLLAGNSTPPFRVDTTTGEIFVMLATSSQKLDREDTPTYTLTVVATDSDGQGLNSTAEVSVILTDINDHPPNFTLSSYAWHVPEDVTFGHVIDTIKAKDADIADGDENTLRYSLEKDGNGKFYLDRISGRLQVAGPLDREAEDFYRLVMVVTDGQFNTSIPANVTVDDVNDNCPKFRGTVPQLLVMEESPPYSVYNFTADDSDLGANGTVTFVINDTAVRSFLFMSTDGELRTTKTLDLESESESSFDFLVWAQDGGQPPCMTSLHVRLKIEGKNEFDPEVCQLTLLHELICSENFTATVYNDSAPGTFLAALRGHDNDTGVDGHVTLSLTQDPGKLLTLNPATGVLTLAAPLHMDALLTQGLLGGENNTYSAKVTATDGGNPTRSASANFTLRVRPRAPNTPVFTSNVYNFSVPENQIDYWVGSVSARLPSGQHQLEYGVDAAPDFLVDEQGNITTKRALDREKKDQHAFLVLAWDNVGQSDTASTVVLVTVTDVNDNNPKFSLPEYDVDVSENAASDDILTLVATDNDLGKNGRVTFTLLNASVGGLFFLNETNGQLSLNGTLDREKVPSYTLLVQASDAGSPPKSSTAVVKVTVLDKNDNSPTFSQTTYIATLDENSPPSTKVINITAYDPDEGKAGQVVYSLEGGDVVFYINEFTGMIYTSRPINYEDETIFTLHVTASDLDPSSPLSSTATVTVYINNLPDVVPILNFDPQQVALVLGTATGARVPVNVTATGASGNFTFNITGGNDEGLFAIDEKSGEIRVTSELKSTTTYALDIRASNAESSQYFVTKQLPVVVTAVTLGQESYAAVRPENDNSNLPALILDINSNAERVGIPVKYRLTLNDSKDPFYINEDTGQIYCNASLDRESKAQYIMLVSVDLADSVSTGRRRRDLRKTATVVVFVKDVNDNPPSFDRTSQIFGIPDNAPAYTVVTTLRANDPDENSRVTYTVTSGDTDVFSVTSDGEVRSLQAMPMVSKKSFDLTVTASDQVQTSAPFSLKIVAVPADDRFGLTATITVDNFNLKRDFYVRNLSSILDFTLQLDKVEPHQGATVDTTTSDIYFYAFDANGSPVPFSTVKNRVTANAEAIRSLFQSESVEVVVVTDPTEKVRVVYESKVGAAEIAVLVVACLIFLGSFVAIIIVFRAWKKQKALQKREEDAARARQRLEQESRQLADKMQETTFVADPEEPLELDMDPDDEGRVFNPRMFLKNMRESDSESQTRVREVEEQECVIYLGNENSGLDTIALRRAVQKRETDTDNLETVAEEPENDTQAADSGLDVGGNSSENNGGSVSSSEDGAPGPRTPRASPVPGAHSDTSPSSESGEIGGDVSAGAGDSVGDTGSGNAATTPRVAGEPGPGFVNPAYVTDEPVSKEASVQSSTTVSDKPEGSSASLKPAADSENPETIPEDPKPDYPGPKRVSFSGILEEKEEGKGDSSTGSGGGGGGDATAGARVIDGWSEDFDNSDLPGHEMSTAL